LRDKIILNFPHEYIHLPSNPGFGFGHNVAIRKAQQRGSAYHLVLNADVYFDRDVLSPMLAYMSVNQKVGQMMPKVLNPDGTVQRLCKLVPTPMDLFFRRILSRKKYESTKFRFELSFSGYDKIMFAPYLSGCFMLLRQNSLKKVGLFDERYFMYPEDIDMTRRMAMHYETIFFPDVVITHEHGAASRKSLKMFFIHIFNLCKYFNKWGWLFDKERDLLNARTLNQFKIPDSK
jgi:GT2 family glycosyltransferase